MNQTYLNSPKVTPAIPPAKSERGYRGQCYWCYRGQLHAVVRENILMRHRRFEVFHWSRLDSKHETLTTAKKRVLELLKEDVITPKS